MRLCVSPLPAAEETHLWHLRLDVAAVDRARLGEYLSADERLRASRFRFERDQRRYVAARGRLREVLASYLDATPAQISFAYGASGKPRLAGLRTSRLRFSLSHTGDRALVAVTRDRDVGVDLETIRHEGLGEAEAALFLSAAERRVIERLPAAERTHALYALWVRKEAYAKARGAGLALDFRTIDEGAFDGWDVRMLDAGPGFTAALAVQASGGQVATVRDERGARHEGRIIGREEQHRARDLHRLRDAPQRVHLG